MIQMKMSESCQDLQEEIIVIPEQTSESNKSELTRFDDLGLPRDILVAIKELGFEYCTPIQEAILSQVFTLDALVNLLERKGLITKEELIDEIKSLHEDTLVAE